MDRFSLDELLRHIFAGSVLLATAVIVYPTLRPNVASDATLLVAVGTGAVVVCGSLIYILHRALIYPLLYYVAVTLIWGRKGKRARIVDIDLDRFARRSDEKSIQKQLGEWGAQVHFLYCITWAVIFGLLAGPVLGDAEGPHARKLFILFACVAGVAAIVHHLRYMFHDREIALRERVNRNALPSTSAPGGLSSL